MTIVRRSSRPLLTYSLAAGAAFLGTWGVTASEARWANRGSAGSAPTIRSVGVVVEAGDPPPPPDSLAALLIDDSRPPRYGRGQTAMLRDVIAMTDQIWSSSERAAVLAEVATLPVLDSSIVAAIARASMRIPSASDRTEVLQALLHRHPQAVGASRRAVLEAIGSIGSTSARTAALTIFVSRPRLSQPALVDALSHVARLPSSERSHVLRVAARANRIEGRARMLYMQAAATLPSRSQRSRALSAIGARLRAEDGH